MLDENFNILFGTLPSKVAGEFLSFFADDDIEFLDALGRELIRLDSKKEYPDLHSFAFWTRSARLRQTRLNYQDLGTRIGHGIVFHVTPGNVPTNFLYSLSFGLLSGNYNIVRLPSQEYPQITIARLALEAMKNQGKYEKQLRRIFLVRYEHNDKITEKLLAISDQSIFWGSNETVRYLQKLNKNYGNREIVFGEKYSSCVMNFKQIEILKESDVAKYRLFLKKFINDSFLFNQNGCSSPRTIYWLSEGSAEQNTGLFWSDLYEYAKREYFIDEGLAVKKFGELCRFISDFGTELSIDFYGNLIYVIRADQFNDKDLVISLRFGTFVEHFVSDLSQVMKKLNRYTQTMTYFGVSKKELSTALVNFSPLGLDRIVPVGNAFDLDFVWDGVDTLRALSKLLVIR